MNRILNEIKEIIKQNMNSIGMLMSIYLVLWYFIMINKI